jgi:hypothetical protein
VFAASALAWALGLLWAVPFAAVLLEVETNGGRLELPSEVLVNLTVAVFAEVVRASLCAAVGALAVMLRLRASALLRRSRTGVGNLLVEIAL